MKKKELILIGCWLSDEERGTRIQLVLSHKTRLELSLHCEFTYL